MSSHRSPFPFVAVTKKRVKCNARELIWGRSRVACRACEWKRRGWRIVCVQGTSPHSTACQVRYLSASNRGTGEDRQHLLSEPNYLLSTKKEGEPAPQPGLWSHKYISGFEHYRSLEERPVVIYYLFIDVQQFCGQNCSLVGIGAGLERIHYQLVLCPAALWQFYDGGDSPEAPKRKIMSLRGQYGITLSQYMARWIKLAWEEIPHFTVLLRA